MTVERDEFHIDVTTGMQIQGMQHHEIYGLREQFLMMIFQKQERGTHILSLNDSNRSSISKAFRPETAGQGTKIHDPATLTCDE